MSNFKFFINHEGDLSQKSSKTNMWLLVNHMKPTNSLYWNWYFLRTSNYTSANRQLQKSWQLQNNAINGAMSISIDREITTVMVYSRRLVLHAPWEIDHFCLNEWNFTWCNQIQLNVIKCNVYS